MAPKFKGTDLVITGYQRKDSWTAEWTLQNYDEYTDHMSSELIDETFWWRAVSPQNQLVPSFLTDQDKITIDELMAELTPDLQGEVWIGYLRRHQVLRQEKREGLPLVGQIREGRMPAPDSEALSPVEIESLGEVDQIFSDKTIAALSSDLLKVFGLPNPKAAMQDPESARKDTQAPPIPNDGPSMHDYVIEEVRKRKELGLREYGTLLQPNNGRDMLQDCLEEIIDLAVYLAGEIHERRELRAERDRLKDELEEAHLEIRSLEHRSGLAD